MSPVPPPPPATGPLVVTVDELRALRRLDDLRLPRFLADDEPPERKTAVRVDAAALRGLAARDLLRTGGGGTVAPCATLAALLAPYAAPTLFVEIEAEADGRLRNAALAGHGDHGLGALAELAEDQLAGLLTLELVADTAYQALLRMCHLDVVAEHPAGEAFTIDAATHAEADELALQGDVPEAVARLVAGGVTETVAAAWVDAMLRRLGAVAVTTAHRTGGVVEAADLRWLVGPDGAAWRVTTGEPPHRSDTLGAAATAVTAPVPGSVITPVGAPVLRAALADLVGARTPAEVAS